MNKISYSAVVLDEKSHAILVELIPTVIPSSDLNNWSIYSHHMTINMGELPVDKKQYLGKSVRLYVTHMDWNNKVVAVKVKDDEHLSTNKIPHVTLAVNKNNGGKPVMSNELTDWKVLKRKFYINGVIKEIER